MKNFYLIIAAALMLSMLTVPFLALTGSSPKKEDKTEPPAAKTDKSTVCLKQGDKITEMAMEDYLFYVVAAEMPADYETEALKAQAVAAYTFTLYKKNINKNESYDISDDSSVDQAFLSDEKLKEKWGDKYSENAEKIRNCIKSVSGIYISYQDAPIYAAYHAISSGKTENCSDVFSGDCPYLSATESIGDLLCPDYLATKEISAADFKAAFSEKCSLTDSPTEYICDIVRSSSGGVKSAKIGDKTFTGQEIRKTLQLRSANFDVTFEDDKFTFTTRGYGHGVGLSQYGANYMAQTGSKYDEILLWYYKDCVLVS